MHLKVKFQQVKTFTTDGYLKVKVSYLPSNWAEKLGLVVVKMMGILVVAMKVWTADRKPLSSSNTKST